MHETPPEHSQSTPITHDREATRCRRAGTGRRLTSHLALIGLALALATTSGSAQTGRKYIWISPAELATRPMTGPAWSALASAAAKSCGAPDLSDQNDTANVCVLAKALVYARTGDVKMRIAVGDALWHLATAPKYVGTALALGRELGTYAVAADLIDLKTYDPTLDAAFRKAIATLPSTPTSGAAKSVVDCHEKRPNNWGTHCGATRVAVAAYLGDTATIARVAQVFKGWLGDRTSYAAFSWGDLSWQCDPTKPVAINPKGCLKSGRSIDGVLPDDQRRAGSFTWPPQKENYNYEALQGALMQAVILNRYGYDTFNWQDKALARAFAWLHTQAGFPADGDDTWQPHVANKFYGTAYPAPLPSKPGKAMGFTDWTHGK